MKCPKCGYTSFPYLESCRQCGQGMTEHRAVFGVYALRPDPPDLLMAYQATQVDVSATTLTPALPSPGLDPSHLDETERELAEAEEPPPDADAEQEPAGAARGLIPAIPLDPPPELRPFRVEPEADRPGPGDGVIPPTFDLAELGDVTPEHEHAANLEGAAVERPLTPTGSPEAGPVYRLDPEGDLDGLTLGSEVDESRADEGEEGTTEYILEIEDELELEIDELTLEEGDESEAKDDDER